jgi:hypothetical protein
MHRIWNISKWTSMLNFFNHPPTLTPKETLSYAKSRDFKPMCKSQQTGRHGTAPISPPVSSCSFPVKQSVHWKNKKSKFSLTFLTKNSSSEVNFVRYTSGIPGGGSNSPPEIPKFWQNSAEFPVVVHFVLILL